MKRSQKCPQCNGKSLWAEVIEGLREDPEAGVRLTDSTLETVGPSR